MFGRCVNDHVQLNDWGLIVEDEWRTTPLIRPYVRLDKYVVMPDHLHGLIIWDNDPENVGPQCIAGTSQGVAGMSQGVAGVREALRGVSRGVAGTSRGVAGTSRGVAGTSQGVAGTQPALYRPAASVGSFVARFKAACTKRINALRSGSHPPVWQRNYYEHIVRNQRSLDRIRQYILDNPRRWSLRVGI
jgi:REP element-mobilizing transposase RayT